MMAGSMRDVAQFGAPIGEYRGGAARIFYGVGGLAILVDWVYSSPFQEYLGLETLEAW